MKCYNGCPDKALQAVLDSKSEARAALKKADPQAWCTYFPLEGIYRCARWITTQTEYGEENRYQELTSDFHSSVESACAAAIAKIKELDK